MPEQLCESLSASNHSQSTELTTDQYRKLWQVIPGGRVNQPPLATSPEDRPRLGYRDQRDFARNERPSIVNQLARMQAGELWDDQLGWVAFDLSTSGLADLHLEPITK
jgi:hypothetical protein